MALAKSLALLWMLVNPCAAARRVLLTAEQPSTEHAWAESDLESNTSRAYREVYVMLPLDMVNNEGHLRDYWNLYWKLDKIKKAGADGFMVDVWWGVTEPQPKVYNFNAYKEILDIAEKLQLKVQLVASFHQCGGNVGDTCDIPLPWFVKQNQGIWYKDQHGNENKEYVSLFADDVKLQDGRTPLEMYSDWMANLAGTFDSKLGNTITEIQVGMGPAGELRYPSYLMGNGWVYCGIGAFQAWDQHALESLRLAGAAPDAKATWSQPTKPPGDAGSYNSRPEDDTAPFFRQRSNRQPGYKSEYGKFFLDWYTGALKGHAAKVLGRAAAAFKGKVALAGKVAGIHWWYGSSSHAAELTSGYYNTDNRNGYWEIAQVFRENGNAALDFTCLEMKNPTYGEEDKCKSRPEDLVRQVMEAAQSHQITFNGENALPSYDWGKYDMILKKKPSIHAFTYLRLNDDLLKDGTEGMGNFRSFVQKMHR